MACKTNSHVLTLGNAIHFSYSLASSIVTATNRSETKGSDEAMYIFPQSPLPSIACREVTWENQDAIGGKERMTLLLFTLSYLLFFFPSVARRKINSNLCLRKKSREASHFPFSIFSFIKRKERSDPDPVPGASQPMENAR